VTNTAYLVDSSGKQNIEGLTNAGAGNTWLTNHPGIMSDGTKHLVFSYEYNSALSLIPAGSHIEIDLTVVLDNTPTNVAGTQFSNTSNTWFNKTINSTNIADLQAWPSTTLMMTIAAPNLVVTKKGTNALWGIDA